MQTDEITIAAGFDGFIDLTQFNIVRKKHLAF